MFFRTDRTRTLFAIALAFSALPVLAAPTAVPEGGKTSVTLSPVFLQALATLKVAPAATAPGRLVARQGAVVASFPITTGAIDAGTLVAEVDHVGGLSLTAGSTVVKLSAFLINLPGSGTPTLTGLVTANGSLVGRLPLFDLAVSSKGVSAGEGRIRVSGVGVTLDAAAAQALNQVFKVTAFKEGIPIGTATVDAFVGEEGEDRDR